jgi:hypothetical protein
MVLEALSRFENSNINTTLVRWVNHILRSYENQRKTYEAKNKAKAKFKGQEEEAKKSSLILKSDAKGKSGLNEKRL